MDGKCVMPASAGCAADSAPLPRTVLWTALDCGGVAVRSLMNLACRECVLSGHRCKAVSPYLGLSDPTWHTSHLHMRTRRPILVLVLVVAVCRWPILNFICDIDTNFASKRRARPKKFKSDLNRLCALTRYHVEALSLANKAPLPFCPSAVLGAPFIAPLLSLVVPRPKKHCTGTIEDISYDEIWRRHVVQVRLLS